MQQFQNTLRSFLHYKLAFKINFNIELNLKICKEVQFFLFTPEVGIYKRNIFRKKIRKRFRRRKKVSFKKKERIKTKKPGSTSSESGQPIPVDCTHLCDHTAQEKGRLGYSINMKFPLKGFGGNLIVHVHPVPSTRGPMSVLVWVDPLNKIFW